MNLQLVLYAIASVVAVRVLFLVYQSLTSPLRAIPGPFWARFSRAWYFYRVLNKHFEEENIKLHRKYGSIVRVAPDWYSVTGRDALQKIYGLGSKCAKSDWYDAWRPPDPNLWNLFTDKNIKRHADTKKIFAPMFSMSSLLSYESFVDQCVGLFINRLTEFSRDNQDLNMSYWFQCYAFDVVSCITFGERFGFLDRGEDIEGAIASVQSVFAFSTLSGIFAEWYPLAFKILAKFDGSGAAGRAYIRKFTLDKVAKYNRLKLEQKLLHDDEEREESLVAKMVRAQGQNPEKISDYHLVMMAQSNIIAGFDSTAITLSFALYFLLKNPRVLQKVREEIDWATKDGARSAHITFREAQNLPYFQAFMKEVMRMHSASGLPFWRVIPQDGLQINGQYFPARTVVGVNSWVTHFDEEVFINPHEFRPERWINSDPTKLSAMNEMHIPFGLGAGTCIGRHISLLEMQKVIPVLVRDFDFELTVPERDWDTENYWFIRPKKFRVRVSKRASKV